MHMRSIFTSGFMQKDSTNKVGRIAGTSLFLVILLLFVPASAQENQLPDHENKISKEEEKVSLSNLREENKEVSDSETKPSF